MAKSFLFMRVGAFALGRGAALRGSESGPGCHFQDYLARIVNIIWRSDEAVMAKMQDLQNPQLRSVRIGVQAKPMRQLLESGSLIVA